jgi:peptidoglycan hydrolase-like protein with peptidoglycan-binding domain
MEADRRRAAQKQSSVLPSRAAAGQQARVAERQLQAGNQSLQQMLTSGALQPKLSVSQPGDSFEQEADRVADQVMRMRDHSAAAAPQVQLKCAQCEDEMKAQRFAVGDEPELVLKKSAGGAQPSSGAESQASVHSALQNGQPLAPAARSFLEPRFGRDLGHVSVHTNDAAADSARALNARAYTVGSDIAFDRGEYQPGTREGQRLLAHEITHTFQQGECAAPQAQIQRTIGDGHDLTSPRFAGDAVLEGCFDNERVVKRTSNRNGPHVRLLQQSLIDMGYTLPGFGVDGIYGKETEAAVKMFQTDAGAVLVDGEVGPETMGLFDRHDTQTPGGIGPPQRTGPVPGPLPAPAATCDAPYTGVTFTLANQVASGVSPAATIAIVPGGASGSGLMLLRGLAPARYVPDVTINAPTNAIAQGFQVGFASNILTDFVEYFYSSATVLAAAVPAAKDGVGLASGNYDPVFVTGPAAGLLENFAANGDTRHLVWPDAPSDAAFVNSADNPECGPGVTAGTLVTAAMIDTFRTWVVARHRASGCTRALHHIDWDINWQAIINTNAAGVSTVTVVSNVLNVTEPDGDGQIAFIQGGQVANDLIAAHRNCT